MCLTCEDLSFCFVAGAHLPPLACPMIRLKTVEARENLLHFSFFHVLEWINPPRSPEDLGFYFG